MADCSNTRDCPCTAPCANHGKCCACVAYHRGLGELPGCFFSQQGEATWDRSLEMLCKDRHLSM